MAAKPPLVVASASKPSEAKSTADPMSHALGMRSGVPGTCSERNRSARLVGVVMPDAGSGNSQYWNSHVIGRM